MRIEELKLKDTSFSEDRFITKANSRIKKLFNAISLNKLSSIEHFLSEDMYRNILDMVESLNNSSSKIFYGEVNATCSISDILEDNDFYIIIVDCSLRYLKYYVDSNFKYVSGDNNNRIVDNQLITFKKNKAAKDSGVFRCLGCGATFNINADGVCPSCGRVFDLDEFDYIISDIRI